MSRGMGRPPRKSMAWRMQELAWRVHCTAASLNRRFGLWGWCAAALSLAIGVLGWLAYGQVQQAQSLARVRALLVADAPAHSPARSFVSASDPEAAFDAQDRLRLFESVLLPHDDIPQMVQDLLQWAQDEGLSIERGDYQAVADQEGGFMRYRMSLPVRGKSMAVHRLIHKAMLEQKHLTIESLQFKRERVISETIEARIQWVALTQLPQGSRSKSGSRTEEGSTERVR
ncbi:hypothetical protein [Verminephrobacter aporrectodeae]|uniref:hypothetical protein n=1 Tax=Verminephrobacter aporrectodeae TaxID=1110389 RepID=UPI002237DF7A|nr:hypothetical protein [Verminephrobacter aporrectodeae]